VTAAGEVFASDVRIVLSTAPDAEAALRLGRTLVGEGLAACVNVVPGVRSIYRWREAIEEAEEVLAFDPTGGAASYLQWIADVVRS